MAGDAWPRGLLLGALPSDGPPIPLKLLDTLGTTLLALVLVASKVEAPHSTFHIQDIAFSFLFLLYTYHIRLLVSLIRSFDENF